MTKMTQNLPLGNVSFGSIAYDDSVIANALQRFVKEGSFKGKISVTDLVIVSDVSPTPASFDNLGIALSHGTKLFDALMYFSLGVNERPSIMAATPNDLPVSRDAQVISSALFFLAFMLLTRARVPSGASTTTGSSVPAFLGNVMGLTNSPDHYMKLLSSFDLSKMNHRWIQFIQWNSIGTEAMNRFGLGVAGYRAFAPFTLLNVRADASPEAKRAAAVAKEIATRPADWCIHPVTRHPRILQIFGNLNKNLGNLMIACFESDELRDLATNRVIYEVPISDPRYNNWKNWEITSIPAFSNPIFQ
jgi:hypothetical protein